MIEDGHELANHTMFDKPSFKLPLQELERQVDTCEQLIEKCKRSHGVSEGQLKWFRPGHGWVTPSMLQVSTSRLPSQSLQTFCHISY
eukprot:scaffold424118_cov39-Prasinocladus_malaysianus.AAC.1